MDIKKEQAVIEFYEKGPAYEGLYGYGSAVFPQKGYDKKSNLTIDTLCIVSNIKDYLLEDLHQNPQNYSAHQRKFILSKSNDIIKGKNDIVFFSSGAISNGYQIKRGFAQLDDTLKHAMLGDRWYLLWRLQKPVYSFKTADILEEDIIQKTRTQGVLIGLLTLEEDKSTFYDLYTNIYGLSYKGDCRNGIFENPDKIKNSVENNLEHIQKIYKPIHESFGIATEQDLQEKRKLLLEYVGELLPYVKDYLTTNNTNFNSLVDVRNKLNQFIKHQNRKECILEPIHGLKVNGLAESSIYLGKKLGKSIGGYKKRFQKK